jgi:hypothetical protein
MRLLLGGLVTAATLASPGPAAAPPDPGPCVNLREIVCRALEFQCTEEAQAVCTARDVACTVPGLPC